MNKFSAKTDSAIQFRIGNQSSTRSKDVDDDIATIKEFFEIDAIESFGNIPSLRQRLLNLSQLAGIEETGAGYLERHPKMLENTRQILEVKKALSLEVKNSIEDLRDKHNQLSAQESEFNTAMQKVQEDSRKLSEIEETLNNYERQLAVVRRVLIRFKVD